MRALLSTLAVCAAAATLSACGPTPEGVSGLTVDDAGQLVALVATCDTGADRIEVRINPGGTAPELTTVATVPDLDIGKDSTDEVGTELVVADLAPRTRYELHVHATDNDNTVVGVDFTTTGVGLLEPGLVITGPMTEGRRKTYTSGEFYDLPC